MLYYVDSMVREYYLISYPKYYTKQFSTCEVVHSWQLQIMRVYRFTGFEHPITAIRNRVTENCRNETFHVTIPLIEFVGFYRGMKKHTCYLF